MRNRILFICLLQGCVLAAGCALPAGSSSAPAAPAARPRPPAARLSPEQLKKIEQLYYKAVGAYSGNDLPASETYLKEILSLNPSYQPALDLREKIRLAGRK